MNKYTIYNTNSGIISKIVEGDLETVKLNSNKNESYILGAYSDDKYIIKNNEPIKLTQKPNEYSKFDPKLKSWVDIRTEEEIEHQNKTKLKLKRINSLDNDVRLSLAEAAIEAILNPELEILWKENKEYTLLNSKDIIAKFLENRTKTQQAFVDEYKVLKDMQE